MSKTTMEDNTTSDSVGKKKFSRSDSFRKNKKSFKHSKKELDFDEVTEDVSSSESENEQEDVLAPLRGAVKAVANNDDSNTDRRQGMMRMNSVVIAKNKRSKAVAEDHVQKPVCDSRNQPITFLELIERESRTKALNQQSKRKSCLSRKLSRQSSFRESKSDHVTSAPKSKAVRFATNTRNKVWAMVKEYQKVAESVQDQLWWTQDELCERYEHDAQLANSKLGQKYREAMLPAYELSKRVSNKVDWDSEAIQKCWKARGLEAEVLGEITHAVQAHTKAVLKAQSVILGVDLENKDTTGQQTMNDAEAKLVRLQSLKFSRRSTLIAAQMAQHDRMMALDSEKPEV